MRRLPALVLAVLALATPASAGVGDPRPAELRAALREPGVPPGLTGTVVLDLDDGSTLFAKSADRSLLPASTEKLTVALAALQELGPDFRIETVVFGHGARDGAVWRGSLVLKGYGDPSLDGDDLVLLARRVRALGIRSISGRILGDESFFDRRRTAPGWKPSYYKLESAPISALIVERAWLKGRMRDEPARAAATRFTRALEAAGVDVAGKPALGRAAPNAIELAQVTSPSLARLVDHMNTESDNFVAEMLLKQVGARAGGGGTTEAGATVVRRVLAGRGVPLAGVRIVDGSGLSLLDRLTARALAALLRSVWRDPELRRPFIASLPVAGVNGTLEDRMTRGPARGVVRAKTGTTSRASSLAGYAGGGYIFAILMNGNPIPYWSARVAQDRFAQILARAL